VGNAQTASSGWAVCDRARLRNLLAEQSHWKSGSADWFYVPNAVQAEREIRRSYVLWREFIAPTIAPEFASGDGVKSDRPLSYAEDGGTTWQVLGI